MILRSFSGANPRFALWDTVLVLQYVLLVVNDFIPIIMLLTCLFFGLWNHTESPCLRLKESNLIARCLLGTSNNPDPVATKRRCVC